MYHYVYRITNTISNKHYYGKRSCNNLPSLDLGVKYFSSSHDELFIRDQKQNQQNYKYKIIRFFATSKDAVAFEIKLHVKFDVGINENFYNKSKQTSIWFCFNRNGITHSDETKQKISDALKGENSPMYGKSGNLCPNFGKKHSDETKQKMSKSKTGKNHPMCGKSPSDETCRKISDALKGENNPMYGKKHSDETKQKMSKSKTGNKNTYETMWINNGISSLRIKKNTPMPDGFCKGRIKKNLCF